MLRKLNNIKNLKFETIVAVFVIAVLSLVTFFSFSRAQQSDFYVALGVNKTEAFPGEEVHYGLHLKNNTSTDITNVLVSVDFDPNVDYVDDTTTLFRDGKEMDVPDTWITTGINIGTLNPGEENILRYSVTVNDSAKPGVQIQTVNQVKADQYPNWIQRTDTVTVVPKTQVTTLGSDNLFKVTNNTLQNGWQDSVDVEPNHVVEFNVRIFNTGSHDARNLTLKADLPANLAKVQHPKARVWADNANEINETVEIRGTEPFFLSYRPGHATLFGTTDLYDCPNGCLINESFYHTPLVLGRLEAGKAIQVTYKADVITEDVVTPTPTPTGTPKATPTPSVTPTPTPTGTPKATPTPTSTPEGKVACVDLEAEPREGTEPLTVKFKGKGETKNGGEIKGYKFNFGDGSSEVEQSGDTITHVYNNNGDYNARVWVKDAEGNWHTSDNCTESIKVKEKPEVKGATAPPTLPKTGSAPIALLASALLAPAGAMLLKKFKLV